MATKAEDLAILDATIATLGRDSYLGPWLASVRAEVAWSLTSDLEPTAQVAHVRQRELSVEAHEARQLATEKDLRKREVAVEAREQAVRRAEQSTERVRNELRAVASRI